MKIDKRWVGLQQVWSKLDYHLANTKILSPVLFSLDELLEMLRVDIVDRNEVIEDDVDLSRVEQSPALLVWIFRLFCYSTNAGQNLYVVALCCN